MDEEVYKSSLAKMLADSDPEYQDCSIASIVRVTGGISRQSARLTVRLQDGNEKALFLQRDPPGGSTVGDIDRQVEWDVLNAVSEAGSVSVPKPVCFAEMPEIGVVLICEAIDAPDGSKPLRTADPAGMLENSLLLAEIAASVHQTDLDTLPSSVPVPTSWNDYLDQQIAQWSEAERNFPGSDPFMRFVGAWLDANRPTDAPLTLLHGDFQLSNVIVPSDAPYALLDWELSRVGDPREDLGWFQVVAGLNPPDLIGANIGPFCERYRAITGLGEDVINPLTIAYFTILSTLKVFVGIQSRAAQLSQGPLPTEVPYTVLVQSHIHRMWMGAIQMLEQAKAA